MCSQLEKTSNKLKINHDCCNTSYTFTNDKIAADIKAEILNDNGWKIDVGLAGERKEADKKYKITGTMDVKNKDLAGAKLCMNAAVEVNEKSAITVKPKINIEVADEFNVGFSGKTDLKGMQEMWPQFVYNPKGKDSLYWVRLDMTRKMFMAGCD